MNEELRERLAALEREVAAERRARQALVEASVRLNSLLNLSELLHAAMEATTDLLGAETGSLMLLDETTHELVFEVATGESGADVKQRRVPADRGIAGWVLRHNEPALVADAGSDSRFYPDIDQATGFETRSMLATPLKIRDRTIGVVEVINKRDGGSFTQRDRDLATALAAQAAVAIENARLYQRLADALVECRLSYRL
jgi:GAF domain-containing protein